MLTTKETIENLAKTEAICLHLLDQVRAVNLHLFGQMAPPLPEGPKIDTSAPAKGFINDINDANRSVASVLARALTEIQFTDKTLIGEREFGELREGKPIPDMKDTRPDIKYAPQAQDLDVSIEPGDIESEINRTRSNPIGKPVDMKG
jgi:hypothetical protein